jgi:hypothetical protein
MATFQEIKSKDLKYSLFVAVRHCQPVHEMDFLILSSIGYEACGAVFRPVPWRCAVKCCGALYCTVRCRAVCELGFLVCR